MTQAKHFTTLLLLLFGFIGSSAAQTEAAMDPTRPASQWLDALAPLKVADAPPPDAVPLGVQIMVIGPTRRFAVLDGHVVHVGEIYQGAVFVAINTQGMRMRKDGATVDYRLHPAVRKKVHVSKPIRGGLVSGSKVLNGESQ